MDKDFATANGVYKIKYAPTEDVENLIQYMVNAAEQLNLVELVKSFTSLDNFLQQDVETIIPLLQQIICKLEGSKVFSDLVYKLLECCTINNIPVTRQLFDDKPQLREDYYELKWEVVKFNLAPFFKRLSGKLLKPLPTTEMNP